MATPNVTSEMAAFFDFGEAAMPDAPQDGSQDVNVPSAATGDSPAKEIHTGEGLTFEDSHQIPVIQDSLPLENTEFNSDFSSWLPRYQKPSHPCDYCRSRSLECFIYNSTGLGQSGCSPCNALFRPCSFTNPEKMPELKSKTALDTLDVVGEDEERCFGGLTGRKPMRMLGHVGPIEDERAGDNCPKKGAAAARFPREAVKVLKEWMIKHIDHPYPTEEEKEALKEQTGLSIGQISNWMANTRRRQKARPKRSSSPSIRPSTEPLNIPPGRTWESLNPFERWKHSPPENEPAPFTAIARAIETFDPPQQSENVAGYRKAPSNGASNGPSNDSTSNFSMFRAPSVSSLETGLTNMSSGSMGSLNSAYSYGSKHSFGSINSLRAKEKRRRRRVPNRAPKADLDDVPRLFQCTFCTDRFKTKYDWSRHEKSLHLSLEKWICAPLGDVITCSSTGRRKCVYCDTIEPSEEHLATHNHVGCSDKGLEARTFYRKDHLRQHLRLMHGCKMTPSMETWRAEAQVINCRCGFCGMTFTKWQDRVDHLAKEYRNGANMKDWKGCRGLDAHVALHVTNAMPPYLIANESMSPFPFSASNSMSMKHHGFPLNQADMEVLIPSNEQGSPNDLFVAYRGDNSSVNPVTLQSNTPMKSLSVSASPNGDPNATCWEVLTLRLGRFTRQYKEDHGLNTISDELLQKEARNIIYGEPDDPWNQTAADNPEWLNLFKQAHGINNTTSNAAGRFSNQSEVFEDMGLRPGATVDQSFNINNFSCQNLSKDDPVRGLAFECSLTGTTNLSELSYKLASSRESSGRQSPHSMPGLTGSTSTSPASHMTQTLFPEQQGVDEPISEMECTVPGGPCFGEEGEVGFAVRQGQTKRTYFLSENTPVSNSKIHPVYECTKVHYRSFDPIVERECTRSGSDPIMEPIREQACARSGEPIKETTCSRSSSGTPLALQDDFAFPTWDELPTEFQNPTTSAGFESSIPVSAIANEAAASGMPWDDSELAFTMDMDLDLDLDAGTDAILSGSLGQQH